MNRLREVAIYTASFAAAFGAVGEVGVLVSGRDIDMSAETQRVNDCAAAIMGLNDVTIVPEPCLEDEFDRTEVITTNEVTTSHIAARVPYYQGDSDTVSNNHEQVTFHLDPDTYKERALEWAKGVNAFNRVVRVIAPGGFATVGGLLGLMLGLEMTKPRRRVTVAIDTPQPVTQ